MGSLDCERRHMISALCITAAALGHKPQVGVAQCRGASL